MTLPATAPPTDLRIVVLEEGDGAVVGPFDSVTVNYQGTAWETGEIFDSSFERGEPATFQVQGVVQGFMQALVNQKVGSRVLVTMPPALGYGGSPGHELETSTLVFLIDMVLTPPASDIGRNLFANSLVALDRLVACFFPIGTSCPSWTPGESNSIRSRAR